MHAGASVPADVQVKVLELYASCFRPAPFGWTMLQGDIADPKVATFAELLLRYLQADSTLIAIFDPHKDLAAFSILLKFDEIFDPVSVGLAEFGARHGDNYFALACVAEACRQQGLYELMIEKRSELCDRRRTMWVRTHVEHHVVQRTYQTLGFEIAGSFAANIGGVQTPYVALSKSTVN